LRFLTEVGEDMETVKAVCLDEVEFLKAWKNENGKPISLNYLVTTLTTYRNAIKEQMGPDYKAQENQWRELKRNRHKAVEEVYGKDPLNFPSSSKKLMRIRL